MNPAADGAPSCRLVSLQRTSGEIITVVLPARGPSPSQTPPGVWSLAILGAGSLVLAWFVSRLATAPLQRLARAASGLGDDIDRPALVTNGPEEVREAARAFNRMQTRLQDTLRERTFMLAAITHDLQTPLTRHGLRLEQVEDPVLRNQLLSDQTDMQTLIRNGLELARASGSLETREPLDIDSLLTSLAKDAVDARHVAKVVAISGAVVATHPSALRRCLANLMDNAIKYAGPVEIGAACHAGQVVLRVLDRGPAIPPDQIEAMKRPFARGEPSRSRETGGIGLGLAITAILAERLGARLALANRDGGGLEVTLLLPPYLPSAADQR